MALFKPFNMNFIRAAKPQILREVEIDLSTARTNEEFSISGDFLHVLNATGRLKIRMNEEYAPQLDLRKIKRITSPFYRLFLTNPAQTDVTEKVKLLVGTDAALKFEERRTSLVTITKVENETLTNAAGSTAYTVDISGYKNVRIYFDSTKDCTCLLYEYPENPNFVADYVYSEQIYLVDTDRKFTRVIDSAVGGLNLAIYNEDGADDMTYTLMIVGEK